MPFLSRLVVGLCLAVLSGGCARSARPPSEWATPRFENALQVPLDEALAATRKLLEEQGFTLEASQEPGRLVTSWKGPDAGGRRWRYVVTGIAVGPRQSVVHLFLMKDGLERGTRDPELERALALRLQPVPETPSGTAPWELPPPTPVRGEDFYLTGWREESRCEDTVRGARDVLKPGLLVLIGEQLGSSEVPAVVGDLVCEAASLGLPVALGLSIPDEEQPLIDRYLASPGAPADQDALLEGHFWRRPYQDGRSSRAIFDLIDRVRAMRAEGLLVSLVAYDTDKVRASERDAALARVWLKRHAERPEEVRVVLAGNTHTRTVTGTAWDRDFTPMAHHLQRLPALLVLELGYAEGKRWGCNLDVQGRLDCAVVGAKPERRVSDHPGLSPYLRLYASPTEDGFQGLLFVGALSPSLPAVEPPAKAPPVRYLRNTAPPPRRIR